MNIILDPNSSLSDSRGHAFNHRAITSDNFFFFFASVEQVAGRPGGPKEYEVEVVGVCLFVFCRGAGCMEGMLTYIN